ANEPFSDGMSDEITTALDRVTGLTVAARSTAFGFKGSGIEPREVGRRLHVRYVLDGGVRVGGDRRRVSVQLIDVASGSEVWSENYDRDVRDRDIFGVQDSIARAIVTSLRVHLTPSGRAGLASRATASPEAHDAYLKGRFLWGQRGTGGAAALHRAIEYFDQAIALDSNYAQAWSGLADAYSMLPGFGGEAAAAWYPRARAAAERALALDSTLADPYTSLGIISLFADWDWPAAGRELARALAIDSTAVRSHQFRAWYFTATGQVDSAVAEMRTALMLDPSSQVLNVRLGTTLFQARRYREAETVYHQALALDSSNVAARSELGTVLGLEHRYPDALAILRALPRSTWDLQAGWTVAAPLGWLEGISGHRAEALQVERHLQELARTQFVTPEAFAWVAIGLGDTTRALDWLERAYQQRSFFSPFLLFPIYDPLRGQPRFQRIVQDMKLVIPPAAAGGP
ncbi:MAG TPA: tetratricopeptide repeat protein, partial [Gemmatimonadales bacterium]|nr:tetratricopeptide repeat protein [Gemmatimonadales bacterium]